MESKSVNKITYKGDSLLEFKKTYFAFLNTFSISVDKNLTKDDTIKKLKDKGLTVTWDVPHSRDFSIAEDFLLPKDLCDKRFRLNLDDFNIVLDFQNNHKKQSRKKIRVEVFLTIFKESNIGILMFSLQLKDCNTDDIIFLKQCFENRFKMYVNLPSFIENKENNELFYREIIDKYTELIYLAIGRVEKTQRMVLTQLIEIRQLSDSNLLGSPQNILKEFPKQIYGLLTGDEGWRYVPKDVAISKLSNKWSTREFLSVISFNNSIVIMNLDKEPVFKDYKKVCKELRNKYGQESEKYFIFEPEIAGLNHGPLCVLENASVERFLLNTILEPEPEIKFTGLNIFLKERDEIIDTLNKLSFIEIREISDMARMIKDSMLILKDIKEAEDKLKLFESEILIKYNQRRNHLILLLTILGITITVISLMK
jgi:hypothetical protein